MGIGGRFAIIMLCAYKYAKFYWTQTKPHLTNGKKKNQYDFTIIFNDMDHQTLCMYDMSVSNKNYASLNGQRWTKIQLYHCFLETYR